MVRGNRVMSKVMVVHLLMPLLLLSASASAEEGWRPIIVESSEVHRPPPPLKSERFVRDLEMRER